MPLSDTYDATCRAAAKLFTTRYSSSFGLASRSLPPAIRQHIYDIYGLVRIADEIADTYDGDDRSQRLDQLESEVMLALASGYSSNPLVHAFQLTARQHSIGSELTKPFFDSMRMDCQPRHYDQATYDTYIYGSAEVVGLMCLRVFVEDAGYRQLQAGARHLGAAFQKVNFLRDLADDYRQRQRYYFPVGSFETFNDATKDALVADIRQDFRRALPAIRELPANVRPAVLTAYDYFCLLLDRLEAAPAATIREQRLRLPDRTKVWLLARRSLTGVRRG